MQAKDQYPRFKRTPGRQGRRRNRLGPADGLHRQRDLQRHRRADQNIAAESGECAKGVEGGGEGVTKRKRMDPVVSLVFQSNGGERVVN